MNLIFSLSFLIALSFAQDINPRKFPPNFLLGVANAAGQIEGAWNVDGRGESIWDYFAHNFPEKIDDRSNGDIACDSYHKYKEDIALIKAMGVDHYRLSISWTRVLPTGRIDNVNQAGVQYYKNVLKELKDNGIIPMVTLYHWDLPQILQKEMGGFMNESIADLFGDYARFCFETFGEDIKWWITINEPKQICEVGYGAGRYAPGLVSDGIGDYICAKNLLLAHARAWHIYDEEFRGKHQGRIAIAIDGSWVEPGSDSDEDKAAQERTLQIGVGLYGNPVFNGDWPEIAKQRIAYRSKLEGFKESRLPAFTDEQIKYINGTSDFLGINHYSTMMVSNEEAPIGQPSFNNDNSARVWAKPEWTPTTQWWFYDLPWGLRKFLNWLKNTYKNPEIIITENGFVDNDDKLEDDNRIHYFKGYISACLDAIYEDKVNLTGYSAWSFMDDWEWSGGYSSFLGMYKVDFKDPNRTRIKRKSADFFTTIAHNRCLVDLDKCVD